MEPTALPLPVIGQIRVRQAREIAGDFWSVGGETLDRDYAIYDNYKQFLGPLGAKRLRLQAGWAKCERQPGHYDFAWLDAVVNDALSQGVRPWLETAYGNLLYPGGGGIGLGDGLPTSPAALAAWDAWVQALVRHFRDRVYEWEIWNEPDLGTLHHGAGAQITGAQYADFYRRTAQVILVAQPSARLVALGLAGNFPFAEHFLQRLAELGATDLLAVVTVHGYPKIPDDLSSVTTMRRLLATYAPHAVVHQGETGAPSATAGFGALRELSWTETTQCKWNLRRMLAHLAAEVPYNIFTLADLNYTGRMNTKGLIRANPDKTIVGPKQVYRASQATLAIFDDQWVRAPDYPVKTDSREPLALTVYSHRALGHSLLATWRNGAPVSEENSYTPVSFELPASAFPEPVLVDLRTGLVHAIPTPFQAIPIYDSPVLIAACAGLPLA